MKIDRRAFLLALPCWQAAAQAPTTAPAAPARTVLSITGRIKRPNAGDRHDLDMAALAALPQTSFTTATPWFPAPAKFTGPLLRDVLALAGADGTQLTAVALNGYKVQLPMADTTRWDVVMARLLDDKPMPTREKGPLFIVYPFHQEAELRSERYYSRSAWQLRSLIVA